MNNLYREEILEHYRDPQNFGELTKCDISSHLTNPFCGDDISIYIILNKEVINDIKFSGQGCAISVAAASILTEYARGKTKKNLTKLSDQDMLGLLNIEVSETRKKCALLAFSVLQDCLI